MVDMLTARGMIEVGFLRVADCKEGLSVDKHRRPLVAIVDVVESEYARN